MNTQTDYRILVTQRGGAWDYMVQSQRAGSDWSLVSCGAGFPDRLHMVAQVGASFAQGMVVPVYHCDDQGRMIERFGNAPVRS